jgi:hypothetical protein
MTPANKIRKELLLQAAQDPELNFGLPLDTDEQVGEAYDKFVESNNHWDYLSEFREGQVETNIPAPYSRHYESRSVARKMSDGDWVGWTYWYGGGKHGDPESIDWIEDAYNLTCVEETKMVVVRTFTIVEENSQ